MASKMTKQQLVDENIRLRAECERLEQALHSNAATAVHEITVLTDRCNSLQALVDAACATQTKPVVTVSSLAGRLDQAVRRERAARFFACNPRARSVTDQELLQFA